MPHIRSIHRRRRCILGLKLKLSLWTLLVSIVHLSLLASKLLAGSHRLSLSFPIFSCPLITSSQSFSLPIMGQSIFDRIQAKLELFRLEQRYTRRRNRRSTFQSNAIYVDGEYVFQTPNSTGSSSESSNVRIDALHGDMVSPAKITPVTTFSPDVRRDVATPRRKRLNRFSSIASLGGTFASKERPHW